MTKQIYHIISFILLISTNSVAQSNHLWLRTTLAVKDSLDITYEFEFQNRLQTIATESIPKHPFLNSGRIWIHYSINEKLNISLSPVAFFDHIKYKNKDELYLKSHITEYRNSLAAEYQFFLYLVVILSPFFKINPFSTAFFKSRLAVADDISLKYDI